MISKKVKVTLLASILMVTGIAQTALGDTSTKKDTNTKIECGIENCEDGMMTCPTLSFKDFIGEMKKDIKKEDLVKLEKTYKEVEALEKAEKYEEADKKWDEFYKILDKYMPEMNGLEEMSFEDLIGEMKKDIKKEDLVKLEKTYKEVEALEKSEKCEEADKKWDEFYKILDKYMPEMTGLEEMTGYEETNGLEEMSFEDLIGEMKKDIKKEDLSKLEKIYKEINVLEKADKYDESEKKWNEFYKIFDKYASEMTEFKS